MTAFRDGQYPIDSFIMDYDWFGPEPCGPAGAQGGLNCGDFGYQATFWGNNTFNDHGKIVHTDGPAELLAHFHKDLNMRWSEPSSQQEKGKRERRGKNEIGGRHFKLLDMALFHVRAGIRKPRSYSNIALSNSSGWLLPDKDSVGAGGNNWNYTVAAFREVVPFSFCSLFFYSFASSASQPDVLY